MTTVLFTLEALPRVGGVSTYLAHSLQAAQALGLRPLLMAPRGSQGVDIPLPCDHTQSLLNLARACFELQRTSFDLLYIAEAAALRACLWAFPSLKRHRLRLILHGSEILEHRHSRTFLAMLRHAEKIYTLSLAVRDLVLGLDPSLQSKIVVTAAAPTPHLPPPSSQEQDPTVLLTVGRLHPRKGQAELLKLLEQDPRLSAFRCHIVGPARRGGYAQTVCRLARALGPMRATCHGELPQSALNTLYQSCGVFVLPARRENDRVEGYGLALLDAMACGLVPVAYASGGVPEVLDYGRNGILVPEGNHEELIQALLRLQSNKELYRQLSTSARAFAQGLSWNTVAQRLFAS